MFMFIISAGVLAAMCTGMHRGVKHVLQQSISCIDNTTVDCLIVVRTSYTVINCLCLCSCPSLPQLMENDFDIIIMIDKEIGTAMWTTFRFPEQLFPVPLNKAQNQ